MTQGYKVISFILVFNLIIIEYLTNQIIAMLTVSTPNEAMIHPDQAGIQSVLDGFADGWNRHDAKLFSGIFVEDADFTNVMGHSRHGRLAIEELHEPGFKGIWACSTLTISNSKIRWLKPDVAAVDAWWTLDGSKDKDGNDRPIRHGLLNFIMTWHDDRWLITVMHNMDLPGSIAESCYPS